MKLSTIAFRNMRRNSRRTFMSILAIALAAFSFVFLFSFIGGMKENLKKNIQDFYTGEIRIRNPLYDQNEHLFPLFYAVENSSEVVAALESRRTWTGISPRVIFPAALYNEEENLPTMGMGVDFAREEAFQHLSGNLISGRLPEAGKNEVLITPKIALDTGAREGDRLTWFTQTKGRGSNGLTLEVVGIIKFPVSSLNLMTFLAPLDRIQYFLRMGDSVTEILLKTGENHSQEVAADLNRMFAGRSWTDMTAVSWLDLETNYDFMAMAESMYTFMALIFFLLGSTVIANTTMMVIFERTREIGTIAALGMQGREIVKMFFLEALFIALIGSAAGVLLGTGVTLPLTKTGLNFGSTFDGITMEISQVLLPVITWRSTILVFVLSTAVAALVSFIPSRRCARINPIEALRAD